MLTSLLLAISLNFDTFSVAIVEGSQALKLSIKDSLRVGLFFGIGQALMALIGVFLGIGFKLIIINIDHWIAFVLLSMIGGKLINESNHKEEQGKLKKLSLVLLIIATSIDAVAIGITLAFINESVLITIISIGVITFLVSFFGYYFGKKLGKFCKNRVKLIGGIVLIGIGIRILIQHLFF